MEKIKLKFKKLCPEAKVPVYSSEEAAAFDIYAVEDAILEPQKVSVIKTGLAFEIPKGYCIQFWDRSGLGAKGIHHFAGLIDSDYRGEFKVVLFNSNPSEYKIQKGDRIIQALILPSIKADFEESQELSDTKRADGGFHSTGR